MNQATNKEQPGLSDIAVNTAAQVKELVTNDKDGGMAVSHATDGEDKPEAVSIPAPQTTTSVNGAIVANRQAMIEECAPEEAFDECGQIGMAEIICAITVGKGTSYSFDGDVFLEIDAPVIKSTKVENMYIITAVTKYRKITPA